MDWSNLQVLKASIIELQELIHEQARLLESTKTDAEFEKARLDSMQDEAIRKLKEGREFMVSAIESISSKYNNETEDE